MSENLGTAPVSIATGQAGAPAPAIPVADAPAPGPQPGQAPPVDTPVAADKPIDAPAAASPEPTFFDPKTVPPELLPAYKLMQAQFTKKNQEFGQLRQKIEAYDNFTRDPLGSLQAIAQQYGLQLIRPGQQPPTGASGQTADGQWEPQSWADVMNKATELAETKIMQSLAPYLANLRNITAGNIERDLDQIDPNWRVYEDDMRQVLQAHPTLVKDVRGLYRMAVPEDVYSSRAVQAALSKLEKKADAAKVSSGSTSRKSEPVPRKVSSFQDAVDAAREQMRRTG
jgi:hypothetical protein